MCVCSRYFTATHPVKILYSHWLFDSNYARDFTKNQFKLFSHTGSWMNPRSLSNSSPSATGANNNVDNLPLPAQPKPLSVSTTWTTSARISLRRLGYPISLPTLVIVFATLRLLWLLVSLQYIKYYITLTTFYLDTGSSVSQLRLLSGHRSDTVVQTYIDHSTVRRIKPQITYMLSTTFRCPEKLLLHRYLCLEEEPPMTSCLFRRSVLQLLCFQSLTIQK